MKNKAFMTIIDSKGKHMLKNKAPAPVITNNITRLYPDSILSALETNDNLSSLVNRLSQLEQDKLC